MDNNTNLVPMGGGRTIYLRKTKNILIKENRRHVHREVWTEERTGSEVTKEIMYGYHYSDYDVDVFQNIRTAFFDMPYPNLHTNLYGKPEKCYRLEIPVGSKIDRYGNYEIRLNLKMNMDIYEMKYR